MCCTFEWFPVIAFAAEGTCLSRPSSSPADVEVSGSCEPRANMDRVLGELVRGNLFPVFGIIDGVTGGIGGL